MMADNSIVELSWLNKTKNEAVLLTNQVRVLEYCSL